MTLKIKRVYEEPSKEDGRRLLVDRFWPRGLSKEQAALDDWIKDIAPSDALRKWFGHRSDRWPGFREAYLEELERHHRHRLLEIGRLAGRETVTLLFAARNEEQNNAVVIREWISRNGSR